MFNKSLDNSKRACESLVKELLKTYEYVSLLGEANSGVRIRKDSRTTSISESDYSFGYVVKIFNGKGYSEYAFSKITDEDVLSIAEKIRSEIKIINLNQESVDVLAMDDEPLVKEFERINPNPMSNDEALVELTKVHDRIKERSERIVNAIAMLNSFEVSKFFISKNRNLKQYYTWSNAYGIIFASDGKQLKMIFACKGSNDTKEAFAKLNSIIDKKVDVCVDLLKSKPIEPGVYDVITDPSITGLIAHEAFGHGVEMDMFVKNRAKSRDFIGKYVASPLVNMHDGAAAAQMVASYFFDDDGVLAHDTVIIKDGILQTGISDSLSALQLGSEPTGNGRRQEFSHKAYTRMTNTYFQAGKDKLSDMIKSIKHGYYLCDTNNGMEDPKNWQIQCTAQYGLEIKDGKFTGEIVSPVVISGYVPDLLKSISMVSDEFELDGAGQCGKGHKEWVRVCDGGPHLKAKVKLG